MKVLTARIRSRILSLALLTTACVGQAHAAQDNSALTVDKTEGPAKVRMLDRWHTPATGMTMVMPTIASTGVAGNIRMSQQKSVIAVAANTTIEVLEGPVPGLPMQRVVQDRGSAFYDIAPRGDNKLRVEASYLVAVVKGTQFNVTVDADTTTIALFEGSLEIEAPNVGDLVELYAGQIATFHRDDQRISIIDMTTGDFLVRNPDAVETGIGGTRTAGTNTVPGVPTVNLRAGAGVNIDTGSTGVKVGSAVSVGLQNTEVSAAVGLALGQAELSTDLAANIDLGSGTVGIGLDAESSLGDIGLDAGVDAAVDLGGGEIDLGVDVGEIDVGVELDLDLLGDVGDTLTGGIDDLLVDTETGLDALDEDIGDLLPGLGDLLPDPGNLLRP